MKLICFFYAFLVYFIKKGNFEKLPIEERIIGGENVSIKDYPYQLSLLYRGFHFCGASLIQRSIALTAAHCVIDSHQYYSVRAGSSIVNSGGEIVDIKQIISHPEFDSFNIDYDVAIVILAKHLNYGPTIQVIELPTGNKKVRVGTKAITTGWGTKNAGDTELSEHLESVTVRVISQTECQLFYGFDAITDRMICAGYIFGGKDSCQGDSGGPLVANNQLIGITSWGIDCGEAFQPGVYTRVSRVRRFIRRYTGI